MKHRPILWSALGTALVIAAGAFVHSELEHRREMRGIESVAETTAAAYAEGLRKLELQERWEKVERARRERERAEQESRMERRR